MREIAVFCEDTGHEMVLKPLVYKIVQNRAYSIHVLSSRGGAARALGEFKKYLNDVERGHTTFNPDIIIVAIDANCKTYSGKRKIIDQKVPERFRECIVHCIPDPHIERWLLLDSSAFKKALGLGCAAPDKKCEKSRYKQLLKDEVRKSGNTVNLGGFEHAEDIVKNMSESAIQSDDSLKRFVCDLNAMLARHEQ